MDLEALVRPVVESSGLELVEARLRREGRRRILRVTVDRDGGVDLDSISEASERLSRRLDIEDLPWGSYELEVSSPGVERTLRAPRDFERQVGQKVRVRTTSLVEGAHTHTGTLTSAGEEDVTVATESGEHRIPFAEVAAARTVFEWGPGRDGGRKHRPGTNGRGRRGK